MTVGLQLLRAACLSNDPGFIRRIEPELLIDGERDAYSAMILHMRQHHVVPALNTLAELGFAMDVQADEPFEFYLARVRDRSIYQSLQTHIGQLSDHMRAGRVTEAADIARAMSRAVTLAEHQEDLSLVTDHFAALARTLADPGLADSEITGITTGWTFVDRLSGGMNGGDLVTVAGRTGLGKSMLLLWMASRMWMSGKSILFYSMEMEASIMARRLAGIMTRVNPRLLQRRAISEYARDDILIALADAAELPPFNIVDGSFRKTTSDVDVRMAELNPDVAVVDASYLMRPDNTSKTTKRWERLSDVAEQLKAIAMSHRKPLVQSVQFNREMPDSRKRKEPDTGFISGSDTIGQISSLVLAIMKGQTPIVEGRREVRVLKDREGGAGKFLINFQFDPVDFSEVVDSGVVAGENESEEHQRPRRTRSVSEEMM